MISRDGSENAVLRGLIAHHLRDSGLDTTDGDGQLSIVIGPHTLSVSASLYLARQQGDSQLREIEVRARLSPEAWGEVTQFHVGWAADEAQAYSEAVHGWLDGVWPVLRALYDPIGLSSIAKPFDLATVTGKAQPVTWRILVGDPVAKCAHAELPTVTDLLSKHPPLTYMVDAIADAVNQGRLFLDGTPNWGHLFASRLNGQPSSHEATIRGEPWVEGVGGLLNFPWPESDAFMTFRQFYVIQRVREGMPSQTAPSEARKGILDRLRRRG